MRVAMLGSGSRGNCTWVEAEGTAVLVDAGFSGRQVLERVEAIGADPGAIQAIIITHEHADHVRGAGILARRLGVPVHLTAGTREVLGSHFRGSERIEEYVPGRGFEVGPFQVEPFLTVHDAVDPVAVTLTATGCGSRLGVATDLGRPTAGIRHALAGCHFLILEANHDEQLLRSGPYPPSVQARIASSHGHLSNRAAADFLLELLHPGLAGVLLAHLSGECNTPDRARKVVEAALAPTGWEGWLGVAEQDTPTPLLDLLRLREGVGGREGQLTFL